MSARRVGRSVWVFLADHLFPVKTLFSPIGFVWISLDSLVRIETFQWVIREKLQKKFRAPYFSCVTATGSTIQLLGALKGRLAHGGELSLISDFLQRIVDAPCAVL
jgi:hypothetical protein